MSNGDQHQFKDRYMLRLPDGMRDRIKAAAASNNRSMNAEIVATLSDAYPEPKEFGPAEAIEFLGMVSKLAQLRGEMDEAGLLEYRAKLKKLESAVMDGKLPPAGVMEEVVRITPGAQLKRPDGPDIRGPADTKDQNEEN